ncbi:hypothetical protein HYDPIDRAFT_152811, partial [Hydnomerulius pinastri MD-312]
MKTIQGNFTSISPFSSSFPSSSILQLRFALMAAIRNAARNAYLRVHRRRANVKEESVRGQSVGPGGQEESAMEVPALKAGLHHVLPGHTNIISSLEFVPGSDLVVSGCYDGSCRVWSANEGREVGSQMKHGHDVNAVAVLTDGRTMACGGDDGRILVWLLETREKKIEWDAGHGRVWSLSFSSEGTLTSGHHDGNIVVWNASTGTPTAGPFKLHSDRVRSVSFSPSGERIASGGGDGTIRVVYSHSGKDAIPPIRAHPDWVRSVVWSPNGKQIITTSDDLTIKFWDSSDGSLLATCEGHTDLIHSLAISSDGELLASASSDRTVRLWDTST